nr:anaerobic nitric oxide reductase transcription regulator NorR [uncultured bacterium]
MAEQKEQGLSWVTEVGGGRPTRTLMQCRILVRGGIEAGKSAVIAQPRFRIGALPGNDLRLKDATVSGHHCELLVETGGVRVRDLGSRNGTRLGGFRIVEAFLEPGASLQLGDAELVLETTADAVDVPVSKEDFFGPLLGRAIVARELFAQLERVAKSDATVLITGETGSGKELVAEAIISAGDRASAPRVVVDCGSLAPTLIESQLFGHEKGAFTGASQAHAGAFERAQGGTVFLDEVGELPLELQPRLLRVLERREVQRLGGSAPRKVDVRIIAATHRSLEQECNQGRFRPDLFYRLSVLTVVVPPLRERPEDIPLLAEYFLRESTGKPDATIAPEMLQQLLQHRWPGNVRELRNAIERIAIGGLQPVTSAAANPPPSGLGPADLDTPFRIQKERLVEEFERRYADALLAFSQGNLAKAARKAGMDRMAVVKLLARHSLLND